MALHESPILYVRYHMFQVRILRHSSSQPELSDDLLPLWLLSLSLHLLLPDSCWIISSVLQLRKTIQQNWCCLHITCKSYNPTHTITPFTASLVYVHFKTPSWAPIRNPVSKKAFLQPDFSYLSLYSQFYNPCKYTIEAALAQEMKLIQSYLCNWICFARVYIIWWLSMRSRHFYINISCSISILFSNIHCFSTSNLPAFNASNFFCFLLHSLIPFSFSNAAL